MKKLGYYISVFVEEFQSQMAYRTLKGKSGPISEDELKLVRDLSKCSPASEYLDSNTLNEMREAFKNGFGDQNLGEFARAAKLGTKVGKKWCVDIVILAIQYAREEAPSLIYDATFESLF
jgi:hypothetical protein